MEVPEHINDDCVRDVDLLVDFTAKLNGLNFKISWLINRSHIETFQAELHPWSCNTFHSATLSSHVIHDYSSSADERVH